MVACIEKGGGFRYLLEVGQLIDEDKSMLKKEIIGTFLGFGPL